MKICDPVDEMSAKIQAAVELAHELRKTHRSALSARTAAFPGGTFVVTTRFEAEKTVVVVGAGLTTLL